MAKATATCTCATCGRTFEFVAYKTNSRDARSFEEWAAVNITECDACKEKRLAEERAVENEKAADAAKEKNWPELTGSEKQVAWANTIRETGISELIRQIDQMYPQEDARNFAGRVIEAMIADKTSAAWWIDNRKTLYEAFVVMCDRLTVEDKRNDDETTVAEPEQRAHDGIVDITVADNCVSAAYRKDDAFREVVKALGYKWSRDRSAWQMPIKVTTGTAQERAAELGNKLLNAGFAIRIQDADTLRNAIEGNYEPMTHRWIAAQTASNRFSITWAYDDSFYEQARKLPGAKYESHAILVPAREYEAVLDFAHTYGFRLTPGAQRLVDSMTGAVVAPAAAKDAEYDEHPVADILNSSREIIDDLKD